MPICAATLATKHQNAAGAEGQEAGNCSLYSTKIIFFLRNWMKCRCLYSHYILPPTHPCNNCITSYSDGRYQIMTEISAVQVGATENVTSKLYPGSSIIPSHPSPWMPPVRHGCWLNKGKHSSQLSPPVLCRHWHWNLWKWKGKRSKTIINSWSVIQKERKEGEKKRQTDRQRENADFTFVTIREWCLNTFAFIYS